VDEALRAVRAYLRAHPEVGGGTRPDGDAIVVGLAGDPAAHEPALRALAGDRLRIERVARPVRELIRLQARLEAELPAHGIEIRAMSAAPFEGVVRLEVDAAARAFVVERYGDAVDVTMSR
jgi:hypothetical protein